MPTFYLFRHGETYFSKHEIPYKDKILTAPLLPEATTPLLKLGEFLKNIETHRNFTSPISRCKQSVEIINTHAKKEFIEDPRLIEFLEPEESFDHLRKRLRDFLQDIKDETVAICTHGACVAGIKHLVMKGEFKENDLHDYPLTGQLWIVSSDTIEKKNFRSS